MRFSAAAFLAFAAAVVAQKNPTDGFDPITKPAKDQTVDAGKPFEITWEVADQYKDLKVDIELLGGKDPNTLVPVGKIATGIDNAAGKYSWDVDSKLGKDAKYGLSISNSANPDVFQYSFPFNIKAAEGNGDSTVTMTMSQGVKTIRLSSSTPTTTSSSSMLNTTTSTTMAHNSTTSIRKPTSTSAILTTTQPPATTIESVPSSTPTEGAAAHLGAGVMAAVGGVAVALLAL